MPSTYVCPYCGVIVPVGNSHFCSNAPDTSAVWPLKVTRKNDLERIIDLLEDIKSSLDRTNRELHGIKRRVG